MTTTTETIKPTIKIADDDELTPAKLHAWEHGLPFPIEEGDYIQWIHSFRVAGYVQGTGELQMGKHRLPAYRVWNVMLNQEQYILVDQAILMGWR